MQTRKFEVCIPITAYEFYDVYAESIEDAKEIMLRNITCLSPDETCVIKRNLTDLEIVERVA